MDSGAPDCQTAMYCNHYPSWEGKAYREGTLRRIAHTDFEILTLLFQRPGVLCLLHVPEDDAHTDFEILCLLLMRPGVLCLLHMPKDDAHFAVQHKVIPGSWCSL